MHISLNTKLFTASSIAAGASNAYLNPPLWITTFVLGILTGSAIGNMIVGDVVKYQGMMDQETADTEARMQQATTQTIRTGGTLNQAFSASLRAGAMQPDEIKAMHQALIDKTPLPLSSRDRRNEAIAFLIGSGIPGKCVTILNALAIAVNVIPKSGMAKQIEELCFMVSGASSLALGYNLGISIQLARLHFNPNPDIQTHLKNIKA